MAKGDSNKAAPPEAPMPMWQQASNASFADKYGPMINQFRQPVGGLNPNSGMPMPQPIGGPPGLDPSIFSRMGQPGKQMFKPLPGFQPQQQALQQQQPLQPPGTGGLGINPAILQAIMSMQQGGIKTPGMPIADVGGMIPSGDMMQKPQPQGFAPPQGVSGMFPQMMGRRIMDFNA